MTPENKQLELPAEETLQEALGQRERRNFPEFLIVLAKHKIFLISFVMGVAVITAVISLILTPIYTASAKLMPPQQNQSVASAVLSQLGSLAPLVGGLGSSGLGAKSPSDLYVSMLRSRTVADDLIDRFQLLNVYHARFRQDARKRLELVSDISAAKDGVISIAVDDPDPRRAAAMAEAYVEELEKLTKTLAVTDASKRRIFFEREAKSAEDELAIAEQAMKQTEEKTGMIQLDSQAKVMLQAYADLRAAVSVKQVEIQAMQSFATPDNPDLIRAQHELAALQAQVAHYEQGQGGRPIGDIALEKIPARALEYIQKFREVKYRESLLEMMLKQYEIARIDESKDFSLIQTLDKPVTPEKRTWPPRTALVLASTILAFIVGVGVVFLMEKIQRASEDPQFVASFQLFKFYLLHNKHKP
ncbi:MAG TPA: Wzz/FepE/Etk N-terminal domain-containing protein [Candidatus Angelobacter sp.]|nr:Wzz/FepE/Etk N-terminal domain-containing protein [Candidatus Angelobacter sp.]